ncbi:MAG: glycosyltransferase [Vicingaceae bacterium]
MKNDLSACVVVPCYNESARWNHKAYENYLSGGPDRIQLFFVDDGSNDATYANIELLTAKYPSKCSSLRLDANVGKAGAVRAGALMALKQKADFIGYWDADLSTPLEEIERFLEFAQNHQEALIIMGSRVKLHGSTKIIRNEFRHYIGRIIATFISKILRLSVYDTQCGAKLIRSDHAEELFKEVFLSKWLFDVEILLRILERQGYREIEEKIFEFPIKRWEDRGDSKVSWTYLFKLPFDLLKVRNTYAKVRRKSTGH